MSHKSKERKGTNPRLAALRVKQESYIKHDNEKQSILSKKIKERRKECNFSINDLAELVGVDRGTISNWENPSIVGKFRLSNLRRLSDALECDIGYLLGEHDTAEFSNAYICKETGLSESAIRTLRELNGADTGHIFSIQDYVNAICNINIKESRPILGVWGHLNCLIEIPESKPGITTGEQYSFYEAKRLYHAGSIQHFFLELAEAIREKQKSEQRLKKAHEQINKNVLALTITEDEADKQRRQLQFVIARSKAEKTLQEGLKILTQNIVNGEITWEEAEAERDSMNAAHAAWLENEQKFL